MTLANGRAYLAIPGPSVMPDSVIRAMMRASPNIYKGELHDLVASLLPDLKMVARTDGHVAIYVGNGHAAWEASLANTLSRGDKVLLARVGHFGTAWGEMAAQMGVEVEILDAAAGQPVCPEALQARLARDEAGEIKAILVVHVDTSSGLKSDIAALRAAIDAAGHGALLMVDCIASLGCDDFRMDAWGVDVMLAACQKGLMTPAGISFVWFNDRARDRRGDLVTGYWDWRPRSSPELFYQHFAGTAPTHHLYGLRAALDLIATEGLDAVHARHAHLARAIWAAFDAWEAEGDLRLSVRDRSARSHAVTCARMPDPQAEHLRGWCETTCGLTLGIGLAQQPPGAHFRIGHMGHVNAHMILGCLSTIEAGLTALDIPHGAGALDAAARVIAEARPA